MLNQTNTTKAITTKPTNITNKQSNHPTPATKQATQTNPKQTIQTNIKQNLKPTKHTQNDKSPKHIEYNNTIKYNTTASAQTTELQIINTKSNLKYRKTIQPNQKPKQ